MSEYATPTEIVPTNVVDRSIEAISKALSYTYALSIAVTLYDVFCDVVLHSPTVWVYDVVTTAIAVAFLIGGSYALMRREHIRISVLFDRYPKRVRLWCELIGGVLAIVYLTTFAWFAWKMAYLSVSKWELGGSVWQQPTPVIVKVTMVVGVLLMIVQMLANMRDDLRALKREA